jgi:methionyl aminopeptidase
MASEVLYVSACVLVSDLLLMVCFPVLCCAVFAALQGQPAPHTQELVEVTRESLDAAIRVCGPGVPLTHIGATIQALADRHGMSIVRGYTGHGIGRTFHAAPAVLHHRNSRPGVMQLNQTFTIEPMLSLGSWDWKLWSNGWTVVTKDGSLSAQFEHTLLVTPDGAEVLTVPNAGGAQQELPAQQQAQNGS